MRIVNWLFWQFQKHCKHEGLDVSADILEGSGREFVEVSWCRRCGAYAINAAHGLRQPMTAPRATWTGPGR